MGCTVKELWFCSQERQDVNHFCTVSVLAVRTIPVHWAPEALPTVMWPCCAVYRSPPSSAKIKNKWSNTPPHIPSWHAQGKFYFDLCPQANTRNCLKLGHDCFIPDPLQVSIYCIIGQQTGADSIVT